MRVEDLGALVRGQGRLERSRGRVDRRARVGGADSGATVPTTSPE